MNPDTFSRCASCTVRLACFPTASAEVRDNIDSLTTGRRKVAKGETLYRAGDSAQDLYLVVLGSFKVRLTHSSGKVQILDFPITGDLLGLDAIGRDTHACDALALEDTQVCVIPTARLQARCADFPAVQQLFGTLMSDEIHRENNLLLMLGGLNADQRIAGFLVGLSRRMARCGYSSREFNLKMTREDIGNHLGMTLETVSRVLSKLQSSNLVQVSNRHIEICDPAGLERAAG